MGAREIRGKRRWVAMEDEEQVNMREEEKRRLTAAWLARVRHRITVEVKILS